MPQMMQGAAVLDSLAGCTCPVTGLWVLEQSLNKCGYFKQVMRILMVKKGDLKEDSLFHNYMPHF